jgi:hypothetical protein
VRQRNGGANYVEHARVAGENRRRESQSARENETGGHDGVVADKIGGGISGFRDRRIAQIAFDDRDREIGRRSCGRAAVKREFDPQYDRRLGGTRRGLFRDGGVGDRSGSDGFETDLGKETKQFGRGTLAQFDSRDHFEIRFSASARPFREPIYVRVAGNRRVTRKRHSGVNIGLASAILRHSDAVRTARYAIELFDFATAEHIAGALPARDCYHVGI